MAYFVSFLYSAVFTFYALPKDYALVRSHGAIPSIIFELEVFVGLEVCTCFILKTKY